MSNIYLAAPLETFHMSRYDATLALIGERHPGALILSPRELFTSNADWLTQWPALRPTIDVLYLLTAHGMVRGGDNEYIAAGCRKEWQDVVVTDGKPCIALSDGLILHERFVIECVEDPALRRWMVRFGLNQPLYGRSSGVPAPAGRLAVLAVLHSLAHEDL